MSDYLPHRDSELADWTASFVAKVLPDPGSFGLSAEQVSVLDTAQRAFAAALAVATRADTRTVPAVQAKNDARKALIPLARTAAGLVQVYPGTTDTTRAELGLTVRKRRVAAVAPPGEAPMLTLTPAHGAAATLHVGKREGEGRARPAGAKGSTWFYFVGDSYPEAMAGWSFGGNGIDPSVEVQLPGVEPGARVWFTANWFNNRMQPGPACPPISTHVAGGLVSATSAPGRVVSAVTGAARLAA